MRDATLEIAENAFAEIAGRFPSLIQHRRPDDPVEISIEIPEQPGLKHRVWLALQNGDELTLGIGAVFQTEWFPCTKPEKVDRYIAAVTGFLSGEFRVVAFLRDGRCVKARLEQPTGHAWRTVGYWARPRALWPFGAERLVVQNA